MTDQGSHHTGVYAGPDMSEDDERQELHSVSLKLGKVKVSVCTYTVSLLGGDALMDMPVTSSSGELTNHVQAPA